MSDRDKVPNPDSVALAEAFVDGIRNDTQYDDGGYMDADCLASATIDTRGLDLIVIADRILAAGWRPPTRAIPTEEA